MSEFRDNLEQIAQIIEELESGGELIADTDDPNNDGVFDVLNGDVCWVTEDEDGEQLLDIMGTFYNEDHAEHFVALVQAAKWMVEQLKQINLS